MSEKWVDRLSHLQLAMVALRGAGASRVDGAVLVQAFLGGHRLPADAAVLRHPRQLPAVVRTTPFARYALNSFWVSTGSTLIGLLLGVPAAFAVSWSRITWPATVTLMARMAPGTLFLLPWYLMFSQLDLIGSLWALILTHAVITMPIVIWVLLPFLRHVPRSIFEAAQVDGCSPFRILMRIALPLVMPGHDRGVDPGFCVLVELFPVRAGAVQLGQQDAGRGGLQFHRRRRDLLGRTDGCGDPDHAAAAVAGLCGSAAPCQRAVDWCG